MATFHVETHIDPTGVLPPDKRLIIMREHVAFPIVTLREAEVAQLVLFLQECRESWKGSVSA